MPDLAAGNLDAAGVGQVPPFHQKELVLDSQCGANGTMGKLGVRFLPAVTTNCARFVIGRCLAPRSPP